MTILRNLSEIASKHLPTRSYLALQELVRPILQKDRTRNGRTVSILDNGYRVNWPDGTAFHFAHAQRYGRYMHRDGLSYIFNFMLNKYQNQKVKVEPGDVVVEVGSNVGEFACAISPTASRILAFEPDPNALPSLRRNARLYHNIIVLPYAAGSTDGEITFFIETATSDSSVIEPKKWSQKIVVPTRNLASILSEHSINQVDFLKVEAEGYEPEILEGSEDVLHLVKKISVDCSPERNGEPTFDACEDVLRRNGFETWRRISKHSMMLYGMRE